MRRTVCNVMKAAINLAFHTDILRDTSRIPGPWALGRIAWQSKRTSVWEGGYCCTDGGVLSRRMQCRLRLHLRAKAIDFGHLSMQVSVGDRRQQFDAWNVGFRNHIGPFDLGFHSSCNNDYCNVSEGPDQNQHNSPGLYHHTGQNWNYWLHACPVGGGGVLQISSDRNDQMGAKITTPKNPSGFKQNSPKIPGPKSNPQNPFICLTLSLLPEKKYLPKFSYPKKSWNQKFHTQKTPSIIPFTWNLAPPPPPPPNAW